MSMFVSWSSVSIVRERLGWWRAMLEKEGSVRSFVRSDCDLERSSKAATAVL